MGRRRRSESRTGTESLALSEVWDTGYWVLAKSAYLRAFTLHVANNLPPSQCKRQAGRQDYVAVAFFLPFSAITAKCSCD
ncbi:hypothetical protein ACLKA6_010758 [Drosophila palustris]